jgi:23S rRNA C2498 (ribose-2'-O)-methylase RlmM
MQVKFLYLLFATSVALYSSSIAQQSKSKKLEKNIQHNTKVVSKKAGKNVEYVARESGKNIQKVAEKTAVGVEQTIKKIDQDVKKKNAAKGR